MKEEAYYKLLVQKFSDRTATDQELEVFVKLANEGKLDAYLIMSMNQDLGITPDDEKQLPNPPKVKSLRLLLAAAASLLLVISVGIYFIAHRNSSDEVWIAQNFKNDVPPGHNQATLTLGNGLRVPLNRKISSNLALQGNTALTNTQRGELKYQLVNGLANKVVSNTLTTMRKEQYKVVLSDGSQVWLNSESSIRYPTSFSGNVREVEITGEAYFEVAHNKNKPFKVIVGNETIEVLGTHFNVNAYSNEPSVKTTLLEGSVKVSNKSSFEVINPGQQAILGNNGLSVSVVSTEEAVAWKNGYFRFNHEKIESIMRKLSRWYDIDVQFEGPISTEEYSGKISRFRNISEILKVFEYTGSIHFKIEGRRVTVLK